MFRLALELVFVHWISQSQRDPTVNHVRQFYTPSATNEEAQVRGPFRSFGEGLSGARNWPVSNGLSNELRRHRR